LSDAEENVLYSAYYRRTVLLLIPRLGTYKNLVDGTQIYEVNQTLCNS
jgi:hypothetical protein